MKKKNPWQLAHSAVEMIIETGSFTWEKPNVRVEQYDSSSEYHRFEVYIDGKYHDYFGILGLIRFLALMVYLED